MERTSFTTNRSWILGLLTMVFGLAGIQSASAQCPVPTGLTTLNIGQNSATLGWVSNNTPTDNCWVVTLGGVGMALNAANCPDGGQALFTTTVCYINNVPSFSAPVQGMAVINNNVAIVVGGLQPGTTYNWYVAEVCDGFAPPNNVSACAGPAAFQTLDAQYTVSATTVRPSCPFVSPGYVPDGSFTVTVTDGTTCAGTYTVNAQPVAGSGPAGSTPPFTTVVTYIGFGQGNFLFANAGAGSYTVTVTETGPCNPPTSPVVITVVVPDGIDNVQPIFTVTDLLGNILADNDPGTAPTTLFNFGTVIIPEGECGRQDQFFVYGVDNCDGFINAANAVSATATTTPATINPGTQVSVTPDGFGFYLVDVFWSTGTSTVSIFGRDAAGNIANNPTGLRLTATIPDNIDPVVSILGTTQVTIPVCQTTAAVIYTVQVDDLCDQRDLAAAEINFTVPGANVAVNFDPPAGYGGDPTPGWVEYLVTFPGPGNYLAAASFTDANGNTGFIDQVITVQQAAVDQPPVIFANAENASIAACETTYQGFIYSFTITDDCQNIVLNTTTGANGLTVTNLPAGMTLFFRQHVNGNQRSAYFEYRGNVAPGTYFPTISYTNSAGQTASVTPSIVITQEPNQAPDIIMPGNLVFTIPQCQTSVQGCMSITILDDCDNPINAANATFSLGGAPLTPTFTNAAAGYFEFCVSLSAANSGQLLLASYTDADGATTTVDALITVNAQPDTWAPIIIYPSQDIIVNLDACEASSTLVVFEATATDNCGVQSFNASLPAGVTGAVILPSAGGARVQVAVAAVPGTTQTYNILLTATDIFGNVRNEDFRILVTQPLRPVDNLACINNLNVTLGPDCRATIIPDMVLTGNRGCLEDDDFEITVIDSNPFNGPIVDGCGEFVYEIRLVAPQAVQGFTGAFAPGNWTTSVNLASFQPPAQASVNFTATTLELRTLAATNAIASIAMPSAGQLSFNWNYNGPDVGFDFFIINVNNGTIVNTTNAANGAYNQPVQAGWLLVFRVNDDGFLPFAPNQNTPNIATISNFSFVPVNAVQANFTTCWGNIRAEDKTAPMITCPANTNQATVTDEVQTITGALANTDPSFPLLNHACFLEILGAPAFPLNSPYFYDLHTFTVNQTDVYTFFLQGPAAGNGPSMGALFAGAFNPANPCQNIVYQNDQFFGATTGLFLLTPGSGFTNFPPGSFNPVVRVTLPLEAGQTYTLLTTSTLPNVFGPYTWSIFSDGAGVVTGTGITPPQAGAFTVELICEDLDEILIPTPRHYFTDANGNLLPANQQPAGFNQLIATLNLTGLPTVKDNCGQLKVTVSDVVVSNGNCGPQVITRTFRVEDKQNSPCAGTPNAVQCTQQITVRKPNMQDVIFPPFTTYLECDENFPTLANGNPSPAITGYPFIETAFGFLDLNQTYCNLAAQFSDQPRIDICDGTYKFIRTWNVLDWCNPANSRIWSQIIKVGDYTAPAVTCPVVLDPWGVAQNPPTYSTTPFSCEASFNVPMPGVTDVCSQNWSVLTEIVTDITVPVLNQYGQQTGTTTQTIVVKTILPGANRFVTGIPVGNHRWRYTVTDNCGNVNVIECPFRVVDLIEPNAVCDDQLNISIGGQGFARVYASDIDEGSNDNCGPVTIEVRRALNCASITAPFGPWGDHVDFTCCDVQGPNSRVRIELRVTDGSGNQNICWLDVLVEDKIRPFCYAPHNVSINCDELPYDFDPRDTVQLADLFNGTNPPSAVDNCNAYVRELPPTVNLHDCGWGTITRNFQAVDASGNTSTNACRQVITINENHNYWILFPRDYSANCDDPAPAGVTYEEIGCDLLAVSTTDEPFSASGDECYKIFRTYRVINWCEYDGQSAPVVVSRDEDCNGVPGYANTNAAGQKVTDPRFPANGIYVIVRGSVIRNSANQITQDNRVTWYDSDLNPANNFPTAFSKPTTCDGLTNPAGHWVNSNQKPAIKSRGYWEYTQHIIVYDNVRPVITVDPFDPFCSYASPPACDAPVSISFSVDENCTPDDVTIKVFLDAFNNGTFPFDYNVRLNPNGTRTGDTGVFTIEGSYPNYTITSAGLPIGRHKFEIHAEDGCNNVQSVSVIFDVIDCKAPTPICYNGLTVTLMPIDTTGDNIPDTGMAEIWATDFIASPITDCTPPITYSIRRVGQAPDINRTGLVLTCDDPASLVVFIDAWDGAGNRDFCETYLLVQDQVGICAGPATGSIAGTIRTEQNEPVQGVNVAVSGPMSQATTTNAQGFYTISGLAMGGDYTLTPVLDVNYLNGVSTFDLVLISRHILGVQLLDSPYKMIAADVNSSKSITTLDLIQLRRLILAIDTEFANNTSWRFVPANYSFPVPTNPWFENFPEVLNFNNLSADMLNQDFRAVKIGDVNGSALPNLASVEDRTLNGEFALNAADQVVKAGNEYVVTFTGEQMERIRGYQMTLTFDVNKLELVDVVYGASKEENFGMRFVSEGAVTMSWNGEAVSDASLFSLVFRATAEGRLSEMLGVSSRYTRAEAYNVNNDLMGVALNFGGSVVSEGFELYQNQPNPFKGETVIGYNLPEAANVTLTIQDATGKVLRVIRTTGVKGYNMERLNSNDLPATGVLYYTIETDGFTATKKMIIVQ